MFWFKKVEEPMAPLYDAAFVEFFEWYKVEQKLDPEDEKYNSLILNLGMFNIGALNTPAGRELFREYFRPKFNTAATIRLRDLLAHLVAKFGLKNVDRLVTETLRGLSIAHDVPIKILDGIQSEIPTFWLIEMINKCFSIANTPKP